MLNFSLVLPQNFQNNPCVTLNSSFTTFYKKIIFFLLLLSDSCSYELFIRLKDYAFNYLIIHKKVRSSSTWSATILRVFLLTPNIFSLSSSIPPGSPIRRQCVSAWALQELHEVHLSATLQQLGPLHLLALHLVPPHPPHRRPALPLPSWIHGWLLRDGDQPVLLQPLPERRRVCPQRGRVHLYLPWRLHWWARRRECAWVRECASKVLLWSRFILLVRQGWM